ncbi:MAG: KUP/HAK/KT family potassium transporter [Bdellovibrionales bacterium]|nr:KUP/HAK/KT family potassium transporter [Bdellovibrionales bacterium]
MDSSTHHQPKGNFWLLALGALGVVYGDIGTSPLYTVQECVNPEHGVTAEVASNLFGITSLIFWGMLLVVTLKYIMFVMRADNRGEGGIMALLALLPERLKVPYPGKIGTAAVLIIAGAALLFGDGVITPAISVLSAMEGIKVAAPAFDHFVVPLTVIILFFLFALQRKGTQHIGRMFGPIMLVWFLSIAAFGVWHIIEEPAVLKALSPYYAFEFFETHGWHAFHMLGSVVLALTGGEALYADMGHFGKRPIQKAWLMLVFPCLVLNYLGQAAFLLQHPDQYHNPFYSLVPNSLLYPMIGLATMAAVIASQAMISGAYSLTSQAIRLGYFPRLTVKHTSDIGEGQIYVPLINQIIAVLCITLVLQFQTASRLAAAYGLAVTGTFIITSIIFFLVTKYHWKWKPIASWSILVFFLSFDLPLFSANAMKFLDGGWIPFLIGAGFFIVMLIWKTGRSLLARHFIQNSPPIDAFLEHLEKKVSYRIPGTAVFLASASNGVPPVVMRMVKRFHALHKTVILLTVTSENVPYYCKDDQDHTRVDAQDLGQGFYRVMVRYGFMEVPNIPKVMEAAFEKMNLYYWARDILYVLGHETFVEQNSGSMPATQQFIFAFLSRNARNATDYFGLPPEQVIELGTQIDL